YYPLFAGLFFFQAEDGIRDFHVTGVQTCALPISEAGCVEEAVGDDALRVRAGGRGGLVGSNFLPGHGPLLPGLSCTSLRRGDPRSEERRVGKECRSRWWRYL